MTITREQFRELAQFQDENSSALSFYFQPSTPRNKAHKEDTILIKDLVREAARSLETKSPELRAEKIRAKEVRSKEGKEKKDSARADLDRILRLAGELRSNGTHGKTVFACAAQNFWREYEVPARLPGTQLIVDRHFHLKPLAHLLGASPLLGV
ncbi:MAG: hypothetical protein ABSG72_13690, partial [Candidatus Sulfotelmatobacter sp.]